MSAELWSLEALQILTLFTGGRAMHGYAVCKVTGFQVGTVYRILDRFEQSGLLHSQTEHVEPTISRRMPKVIYRGTTEADDQVEALRRLISA